MNLKEKLEIFKEKGWTYNPETGNVYSHTGKLISRVDDGGYIRCGIKQNKKDIKVNAHQLAWFLYYNEVPESKVDDIRYEIDHIDRDKTNNKISNLRYVTRSQNHFNKDVKGYYFNKLANKFQSQIILDYKHIHLGYFETEAEARQAYLDAKKIYHII